MTGRNFTLASDSESSSHSSSPPTTTDSILSRALSPFFHLFQTLTSPTAVKAYLSTLLFFLVSTFLLSISTVAFLVFYYRFIPALGLERPVYLQYAAGQSPWAVVKLEDDPGILLGGGGLVAGQPYDVHVELVSPRTEGNVKMGNFMVDARLLGDFDPLVQLPQTLKELMGNATSVVPGVIGANRHSVLAHVRRPTCLVWRSWLTGWIGALLGLPSHVLGWRDLDVERTVVGLWESVSFTRSRVPWGARLELVGASTPASEALQVYSAKLAFRARFSGLRYVVYNHRIISWMVFSTLFYMVSLGSVAGVWLGLSVLLKPDERDRLQTIKKETEGRKRIKEEEDESDQKGLSLSNISDTPAQFPGSRSQPPLSYTVRDRPIPSGPLQGQPELKPGETADDEEEEEAGLDEKGNERCARTTGRFEGDSGIGTSMESEQPAADRGPVRRRSGRGSQASLRDR